MCLTETFDETFEQTFEETSPSAFEGYKGILFDKDGTLVELGTLWGLVYHSALAMCFEEWGVETLQTSDLKAMHINEDGTLQENGLAAMAPVSEILEVVMASRGEVVTMQQQSDFSEAVYRAVQEHLGHVKWLDERLPRYIQHLVSEGVTVGLVTTDTRRNTLCMLGSLEVGDLFHYLACGDDPIPGKPEPNQGLAFMDTFNLKPAQILMVGDSDYDRHFAKNAGFSFLDISDLFSITSEINKTLDNPSALW